MGPMMVSSIACPILATVPSQIVAQISSSILAHFLKPNRPPNLGFSNTQSHEGQSTGAFSAHTELTENCWFRETRIQDSSGVIQSGASDYPVVSPLEVFYHRLLLTVGRSGWRDHVSNALSRWMELSRFRWLVHVLRPGLSLTLAATVARFNSGPIPPQWIKRERSNGFWPLGTTISSVKWLKYVHTRQLFSWLLFL